jgi:pimeloyl-ACP methyl ester carboxylesterase
MAKPREMIPAAFLLIALALAGCGIPPDWGANALLHPYRHHATRGPRDVGLSEEDLAVTVAPGIVLRGWLVRASADAPRRGLLLYLHGVADTRASGTGLAKRFSRQGWDVAAFDARAHGDSGGELCTYGFFERADLPKLLDALGAQGVDVSRTALLGMSMGAAMALQAAPDEPRVRGVIALASFATLWQAAYERKPYIMSDAAFRASVRRAEEIARFRIEDVAPVVSVKRLAVPLLLIHGERDGETPPEHSRRILAAAAPDRTRLVLVPGVGHRDLLSTEEPWREIETFLQSLSAPDGQALRRGEGEAGAR